MSAVGGHERTFPEAPAMSAFPSKANIAPALMSARPGPRSGAATHRAHADMTKARTMPGLWRGFPRDTRIRANIPYTAPT